MANKVALNQEQEQIVKFMNDPECLNELKAAESAEAGAEVFRKHGIEMDEERLQAFLKAGIDLKDKKEDQGELKEEDLKQVTGGSYYYYYSYYSSCWSYSYDYGYYESWYSYSYECYYSWY